MELDSKIYVAGHRGLVGSALVRVLERQGYHQLLWRSHEALDLCDQQAVQGFFRQERPDYVFLAAAKVGGIYANNTYPADFLYENLMIQSNVIQAAHDVAVKKLLFLGSTCIYPKLAPQPLKEEYLLTGSLEPTNEAYAVAKIAGLKMCQYFSQQYGDRFISCMPTNLYGPNDNFDLNTSHVLPALLRRFHEAKVTGAPAVVLWGTGAPLRDFLYVDDMADACVFLMCQGERLEHTNIGTGEEISIRDLAQLIKAVVQYQGDILFDHTKPDGTPRKLTDVTKLHALGWRHRTPLPEGIEALYSWYCAHAEKQPVRSVEE